MHFDIYKKLIHIGETDNLEYKEDILKAFPTGSSEPGKLYNNNLVEYFSSNKLISLFKGLVICEKELHWKCGSTTPAVHLYQDIKNHGLDEDNSLADWAFQYSANEYIPYGFIRHGEKTAYQYLKWREDFYSKLNFEQEEKKKRKCRQLERAKRIAEEKRKRDESIHKLHSHMLQLSIKEQVDIIITDNKHILYFYMPVIYALLNREDVSKADLEKLLHRFGGLKSTPFRKKVTKLILNKMSSMK